MLHGLTVLCTSLRGDLIVFGGGPVGMNTLATAIGENAGTLEEVYEPFLIQEGLLVRTPRGRQATRAAFDHLGLTPNAASGNLFE